MESSNEKINLIMSLHEINIRKLVDMISMHYDEIHKLVGGDITENINEISRLKESLYELYKDEPNK